MVVDSYSGRILLAHEAGQKRPVASLVKIATAVVTLDWAEASQTDLGSFAVVPVSAARMGGVNPMGLQPGDQISLRDALYSALLGSDNVAAQTLANHVGLEILKTRDAPGDTVQTFVNEMNQLSAALGMTRTRFINPHGLDLPSENGYSTAADMARLAIHAMRKPGFAFFVKQEERKISCLRGEKRLPFTVRNTNALLGQEDINGIKTGLTNLSGQCLAASSERKPMV